MAGCCGAEIPIERWLGLAWYGYPLPKRWWRWWRYGVPVGGWRGCGCPKLTQDAWAWLWS